MLQICDQDAHGCCTTTLQYGIGGCYTSDGTSYTVDNVRLTFNHTFPCPYGDLYLSITNGEGQNEVGHTCLIKYNSELIWIAYWNFVNAEGCMGWTDYFVLTCINQLNVA